MINLQLLGATIMDKSNLDKQKSHNFRGWLELWGVKKYFSPSPPARSANCCFIGFAIQPALFLQHNYIDNIDIGEGVEKTSLVPLNEWLHGKVSQKFVHDCRDMAYDEYDLVPLVF